MENPNNGNTRPNGLEVYHLSGNGKTPDFSSLTQIAAEICKVKIAFLSFRSTNGYRYQSPFGIDLTNTTFEASLFANAIQQSDGIFIIEDIRKDDRFNSNPIVNSLLNFIFLVAAPLISPDGILLGILWVIDEQPKKLDKTQVNSLQIIANQIARLMELRTLELETEKTKSEKSLPVDSLFYKGMVEDTILSNSEEQRLKLMERVVTNTSDSILITEAEPLDLPGPRIVYVNEAFTKMTGYEPEEVIGKSPRILQGPKSNYKELAKLGEAMRRWEPYEITTINYKKNGDPFWINFSVTPIADKTGWFTHWIAIERDVTIQKNLELEKELFSDISLYFNKEEQLKPCLEFVVRKLAELGDFSITEIWLPDFDRSKLKLMANHALDQAGKDFNESIPRSHEMKAGEGLPGRVWKTGKIELCHGIGSENGFLMKEAIPKSEINSWIGIPLSHNDEIIGVLIIGIKKIKSKFSFFRGLFKDIEPFIGSEINRKRLEIEVNQIFSFAPDIICLLDFNGRFRKINKAGCRLLGFEEDEINRMSHEVLVHQEDLHISSNAFQKLKENDCLYNFENRYITKSGHIIWLSWTCNSVVEEGLIYGVAKDVTKLKKLQVLVDDSSKLARVGSWEIDLLKDHDNVFWSDVTKEIREVGPDFEPTLSKGMSGFVQGYDQNTIRQRVKDCIENGIEWDEELQIITEKGNQKWIRTIGKPVFENGKCIRVYGSFQDIHQLKMTELSLKESLHSLESYKFALDQSAIIAITDENGIILSVNENFCKISQYSREEIIGNSHRLLNSGYHSQEFFQHLWESISSGEVWRGEIRNRAKDMSTYWVDTTIVPFIGNDNKPFQYLSIRFDISAKKLAEEKVLATLKEKNTILESIDDGFFTLDKEWIITYWNNRAEKLVKEKSTDIIGRNFWEVFPESIGTEFYHKGRWAMENQEAVQFEEYSPRIKKWIELSVYPSENGLSAYFKDISIRKIGAEQIRLSNERFEKVTEATNDAIWDWDIENGTFFQGKGFEKLFGLNVGLVPHTSTVFSDKYHPDDTDGVISSLNSAIKNSTIKNWTYEFRIINKKKEVKTVIAKGIIIRRQDGKAVRMVGAITDITHQKEYEATLKNLNNELETKAKKLEFSNSELEQFAFIASHDLQEPLRMVTSFLTQLEKKYGHLLDEKAHTYISFATDGATRMKGIIRDLLDYSRAGKVENEKEAINLSKLLNDYILLRKKLLLDNGGSIVFDSLPNVTAHKAPLEQTIFNLLDNALKYSKPSVPPVVTFTVKEEAENWLFSIKDNGLGISSEYFEQIFVIFQRLHNRNEYSGTGMGLAIVKKNIESWNGKIWLDSIKGTGTTFFFTLPK
jgi:PAS domain S-box-containing protein